MTSEPGDGLPTLLRVDRSSPVPLYFQLEQQLEAAIKSGTLPPGTKIETEVELARLLQLSRPTVRQAMARLVEKGVIARRRGAGTLVVSSESRRPFELNSLYDDLQRSGRRPTTKVLSKQLESATAEVAAALQVTEGTDVIAVVRLRSAMDQPIARMTNYLPTSFADLSDDMLEQSGLYDLLRGRGIRLHSASQSVGARIASAAEARVLRERKGAALLWMQRTTFDDYGRTVEYGNHIYAARRYHFEFSFLSP